MTVQECVESWINGNHTDVVDYVLGLGSSVQIAYYAGSIVLRFESQATDAVADDSHSFLNMLATRM